MLIRKDNIISVEHIAWQPIFNCIMGCQGCYVAESPTRQIKEVSIDLLDKIYKTKEIECNQLTISLDTIPESHNYPLKLQMALLDLWNYYEESNRCDCPNYTRYTRKLDGSDLPQLNLATFNTQTIYSWCRNHGYENIEEFLAPLTILSLSNLPSHREGCERIREYCNQSKTILNYNKMADWNTTTLESFKLGVEFADQVHLVLRKNPLGDQQDPAAIKYWRECKEYIKQVAPHKLKQDSCLQDSVTFLQEGWKCGAGISKVHVWPGNRVSGCPYDAKHRCSPTEDLDLIIQMKQALYNRSCHSMDLCKIPETLQAFI